MNNIKKFEDFLDRMRGLLDEANRQGHIIVRVEDLERAFPELKESEDERIRKTLVEFFTDWGKSRSHCWSVSIPKILAWLEKQGEQKPFDYECANIQQKDFAPKEDIPRYNIGDVLCDKSCTTLNKESQSNFEITDIRNGMYICDKCSFPISQQDEYELVAKRIEQNPAWSEEDEEMLTEIITDVKFAQDEFAKEKNPQSQMNQIIFEEEINWLKSLKDRIIPQQKQEWSEEDEEILRTIISDGIRGTEFDMLQIDWLKSLKRK